MTLLMLIFAQEFRNNYEAFAKKIAEVFYYGSFLKRIDVVITLTLAIIFEKRATN